MSTYQCPKCFNVLPLSNKILHDLKCTKESPVELSQEANEWLSTLPFPGNIRELKNLVERTILVSANNPLQAADYQQQYQGTNIQNADADGLTLDEVEYIAINKAYENYHGNVSQMASALGLSRQALYRRMEKYNLT